MSIESEKDFIGLSRVGKVAGLTLREMQSKVSAGMTTAELDEIGARILERCGAQSAPKIIYGFPGVNLISVNDEVVHGIPSDRVIQPGDLVTIDVTAELDGYIADAAMSIPLPSASTEKQKLCQCARLAFQKAVRVARSNRPLNRIGKAVELEVKRHGFSVIPELSGHGVGRVIHEDPTVANYYIPQDKWRLTEGLVITIEPIICSGNGRIVEEADGWTVKTADGSLSAHFEHTVVITKGKPLLLTAA